MTPADIDALASKLAAARRARTVIDFLGPAAADISEEDAYKVQFAVQAKLTGTGADRQAGWKVALATPELYKPAGLSGPAFAGIYQSGIRFDGAKFDKGYPIKPGIECEVVAKLARDCDTLPRPYDAASIADRVATLHCGMEVVDNRYADIGKINGRGRVCDDVLQAACVIGTEIADWRTRDLGAMQGRSLFESKELAAGPGTAVMGGALVSLAWLANKLIEHGKKLRAGDIVLTGSVHVPQFVSPPGTARTEFAGVGSCSVRFG